MGGDTAEGTGGDRSTCVFRAFPSWRLLAEYEDDTRRAEGVRRHRQHVGPALRRGLPRDREERARHHRAPPPARRSRVSGRVDLSPRHARRRPEREARPDRLGDDGRVEADHARRRPRAPQRRARRPRRRAERRDGARRVRRPAREGRQVRPERQGHARRRDARLDRPLGAERHRHARLLRSTGGRARGREGDDPMAGRDGGKPFDAGVIAVARDRRRARMVTGATPRTSSGPASRWHPSRRRPPRAAVRLSVRGQHERRSRGRRSRSTSRRCARSPRTTTWSGSRSRRGRTRWGSSAGRSSGATTRSATRRRRRSRPSSRSRTASTTSSPGSACCSRISSSSTRRRSTCAGRSGGAPFAFEIIDGATIKRILNADGRTPLAPEPAYQQIIKGLPAVDYHRDELLYKPRNPRSQRSTATARSSRSS
jgi:hypothetical protein